ncbi:MAG: DUF115 domain-containing protein [Tannerellaceae bacterium]|jgi:hypothetical protein|nr:DUF115 domain-containing protein [Tannerellaceae bacterium]
MKNLIREGVAAIHNDSVWVFLQRIINYFIVKVKRILYGKNKENIEKWNLIKNKYKGNRIFIIGNGPSLNETPLYFLKNEFTMCFNRFGLMLERLNWHPDFYVVTDDLVIKDTNKEINSTILPIVEMAFFPDIHPSNVEFTKYVDHLDNVFWLNVDNPEFSDNLPSCGINKTVVNAGIQIATHLGFSEIYLVGVDMTFTDHKVKKSNQRNWQSTEDDPNHFDPRYFDKGRKYHNPTVNEMLRRFEQARDFFEKRGVKIYNAGYGGRLEAFPRVHFESLFSFTDNEMKNLLNDCYFLKQKNLDFDSILRNVESCIEDIPDEIINASIQEGCKYIPKLIKKYIPIGPYKERYYFIKRN